MFALAITSMGLGAAGGAHAGVARIYVDANGASGTGGSWADAYSELWEALAAATGPAEIWVAAGTYHPGDTRLDKLILKTGVTIYGGFAGGETAVNQRNIAANPTILSGDVGSAAITDNSYHVIDAGTVGASAVLDGFIVTGGFANGGGADSDGGGMTMSSGSPVVRNVIFRGNFATRGGGVFIDSGSPLLDNVAFEGNGAFEGGGLFTREGAPEIRNSRFLANGASDGGGFKSTSSTSPAITGSLFRGNQAQNQGGAIFASGVLHVESSAFVGNRASDGAAMYLPGNVAATNVTITGQSHGPSIISTGTSVFTHATVAANTSFIWVTGGSLTFRESILWRNNFLSDNTEFGASANNTVTLEKSIVNGGCPFAQSCTDLVAGDPLLGPRRMNGGLTPTLALGAGSPAIDAGRGAICATVSRDQRGVVRPVDGDKNGSAACDLGAFEFEPAAPSVAFAAATSTGTEASGAQDLPVKLSTTAIKTVTVKYAVTGGTAKTGEDYILAAGTLTFPAGSTIQNIPFRSVNDRFFEPSETVVITLSAPAGAALGAPSAHTRAITDNDKKVRCGGKLPTIVGTDKKDTLNGTPRADVIVGLDGNDTIDGKGGNDIICGGKDNDAIRGGGGLDIIHGEAGNDNLAGENGTDLLYGGRGNDRLAGGTGPGDFCNGGPNADTLAAGHGCESQSGVP